MICGLDHKCSLLNLTAEGAESAEVKNPNELSESAETLPIPVFFEFATQSWHGEIKARVGDFVFEKGEQ